MLKKILSNNRVQTILISLLALFTITQSLKYMGLYEGMENNENNENNETKDKPMNTSTEHKKIAKTYNF
jgi:hypothetical protein